MVSFLPKDLNFYSSSPESKRSKRLPAHPVYNVFQNHPLKDVGKLYKTRKTIENLCLNDRSNVILRETCQKEIFDWIRSLSFDERFELFVLNDATVTVIILSMFWKRNYQKENYFLKTHKLPEKGLEIKEPNDFEISFASTKMVEDNKKEHVKASILKLEEEIITNLRIIETNNEFFDSICFSEEFVRDIDRLLDLFSIMSEGNCFTNPCKLLSNENSFFNWIWELPHWFNLQNFQSLSVWIVSLLERAIWLKFFESKKLPMKKFGLKNASLHKEFFLKKKGNLLNFWKDLEKSKKKKIFYEARSILRSIELSLKKEQSEKESKILQYYNLNRPGFRKKINIELFIDHFNSLIDESQDQKLIDSLFLLELGKIDDIYSLLIHYIYQNVQTFYAKKMAEELILTEELEKKGCKRKKKKIQPVKKHKNPDYPCEKCVKNECEIKSYTSNSAKNLINSLFTSNSPKKSPEIEKIQLNESKTENSTLTLCITKRNAMNKTVSDYEEEKNSVVSDTTRRRTIARTFVPISNVKKRCNSNSQEKKKQEIKKNQIQKFFLESEITTLQDSTTDFEIEHVLLDEVISLIEKDNRRDKSNRNLSHEKYKKEDNSDKKNLMEENQKEDCSGFIQVTRKKSAKESNIYGNLSAKSNNKYSQNKNYTNNNKVSEKKKGIVRKLNNNLGKNTVGSGTIPKKKEYESLIIKKQEEPPKIQEEIIIKEDNESLEDLFESKINQDLDNFIDNLHPEINKLRYYRYLIFKRLHFIITCLFPNYPIDIRTFGSCATGLDLPTSDIDIGITGFETLPLFEIPGMLHYILQNLVFFKWIKDCKSVVTATIPVLKLEIDPNVDFMDFVYPNPPINYVNFAENYEFLNVEEKLEGENIRIKIDITIENINYTSINEFGPLLFNDFTGSLSTDLMNKWLGAYPALYKTAIFFKYIFNNHGFNNNYKGGLSSYCLLILIVAFFKKNNLGNCTNFAEIILKFLDFYSNNFNPNTTGIDLFLEISPYFPLPTNNEIIGKLTIIDPIGHQKNLTQNTFMIDNILKAMKKWHDKLINLKFEIKKEMVKFNKLESMKNVNEFINNDVLTIFLK